MKTQEKMLVDKTTIRVRFSEVDTMKIVWHGEYIKYFEDGRESFGKAYDLGYLDVYDRGYMIPLVSIKCDYKRPLKYGESAIVETHFIDCEAAKIKFEYFIYRESNNELVATGESVQVFLNKDYELMLTMPSFFVEWKKRWDLKYF